MSSPRPVNRGICGRAAISGNKKFARVGSDRLQPADEQIGRQRIKLDGGRRARRIDPQYLIRDVITVRPAESMMLAAKPVRGADRSPRAANQAILRSIFISRYSFIRLVRSAYSFRLGFRDRNVEAVERYRDKAI